MADHRNQSPTSSVHYPSDFSLYSDHPAKDDESDGEKSEDASPLVDMIEHGGGPLRLSGLGHANSPYSFSEEFDPKLSPRVLQYKGYLKAKHDLRIEAVQRLQNGMHMPSNMNSGDPPYQRASEDASQLESMLRRVAMYKLEEIWEASLLLVPVPINRHWILIAVTNPCKSIAKDSSRSGAHDIAPGELKPDREPFTILVLNSAPLYTIKSISKIPIRLRAFLEFTWRKLKSTSLEFVDWFPVRCPEQSDSVSCGLHVVRNSEILMREGVAEAIRRASQVRPPSAGYQEK
ncbi:hypothetical protein FRC00_002449 [Tulasnella sp. 408]|nr:hypothetical protein FRC00_002449 [Tulasnella sp. 408]